VGKAADMRVSLATFFCTYPEGTPEYHCPRNGFGDTFGAKNLRAVVVEADSYFSRECGEEEIFRETGKKLAHRIVNDDVCGGALPAYGSITLLKILKDKKSIQSLKHRERTEAQAEVKSGKADKGCKTNYCCAPMCVVGCLNRHTSYEGDAFSSPAQSEVLSALQNCFGWDDPALACNVQDCANEIGIVGTEFVTAAKVYAEAQGLTPQPRQLLEWIGEIERGSLEGRVIASRTHGIAGLYPEKEELRPLLDRKAIMDESLFDVKLSNPYASLSGLKDMELLYAKIFVLENLGFCIFTSFALLDDAETFEDMARMFTAKTGVEMDGETLIRQAHACIQAEQEYEAENWRAGLRSNIPPFTKVLYRYFGQKEGV
jgi:aldehyde:ferredoxin oxidoreductase